MLLKKEETKPSAHLIYPNAKTFGETSAKSWTEHNARAWSETNQHYINNKILYNNKFNNSICIMKDIMN